MTKQENDLTRDPDKLLVLAGVRTGGTFLAHALDSHPQIFFVRGEPLHHGSIWARFLGEQERLKLIFSQTGYLVAGCKLLLVQLYHKDIIAFVQELSPKVIFVYREDLIKQTISYILNKGVREWCLDFRPQHTFEKPPAWEPINYPPNSFSNAYNLLKSRRERVEQFLDESSLTYLKISYEQMTGNQEASSLPKELELEICDFLNIPKRNLEITLRKVNKQDPQELFFNWEEIKQAIPK